jgi:hypothetical protein
MSWPKDRPQPFHPHEYLEMLGVPGMPRTFVLGSFARYQTLNAQQIRAVNLIDSLHRSDLINKNDEILIAGAGVAGMTAAIAARKCGAKVTLLEEFDCLTPFQRYSTGRFLHPLIYDWPFADSKIELPFMNWSADSSEKVFKKLETQFEGQQGRLGNIRIIPRAKVIDVDDNRNNDHVTLKYTVVPNDAKDPGSDAANLKHGSKAILAIGFGREVRAPDIPGYWDGDGITSPESNPKSWLVSGYGDGALTDLVRLMVHDFDHAQLVTTITDDEACTRELKHLLLNRSTVRQAFDNLSPNTRNGLLKHLGSLRHDTEVYFCAPRETYLESADSCILNRLLVYLLEDKLKGFIDGQVHNPSELQRDSSKKYQINIVPQAGSALEALRPLQFDRVIPRHGVESHKDPEEPSGKIPEVWSVEGLKRIWRQCSDRRAEWRRIPKFDDRTRVPTFSTEPFAGHPDGWFADDRKVDGDLLPEKGDPSTLRILVVSSSLPPDGGSRSLKDVVDSAVKGTRKKLPGALALPGGRDVTPIIHEVRCDDSLSAGEFQHAVRQLCRADVVFFDTTNYQPLVMVLLGIRSAVKTGINITCTHDRLDAKFWSRLPFNIKELYPLGIGGGVEEPNLRVANMLRKALEKSRELPDYQDLPSFRAVRRANTLISSDDASNTNEILWLCSYDSEYTESKNVQTVRQSIKAVFGEDLRFLRLTEIVTPELASHKLFDAIRRFEVCVIDWTQWSSNIFFELGVRLAVNPTAPVCLLSKSPAPAWLPLGEEAPAEKRRFEEQTKQVKWLQTAFAAIPYDAEVPWDAAEVETRILAMRASQRGGEFKRTPVFGMFRFDLIYWLIAQEIGRETLGQLKSPITILNESADGLVGTGGKSAPEIPAIYADKNREYNGQVRLAALEYLVAAWRYAVGEIKLARNPSDEAKQECDYLAYRIKTLLDSWNDQDERKRRLLHELAQERGSK